MCNYIQNCTIVPLFKIETPDKVAVQSTIEDNEQNAIVLQNVNKQLKVYKKSLSKINNKVLTFTKDDLWQTYSGELFAHSQSIGATSFPHMVPNGKFFIATGPDKQMETGKHKPLNYAFNVACTNLSKGFYSDRQDITYMAGFEKLLRNLQHTYNQSYNDLKRVEFSVFDYGADLVVMLLDMNNNMYLVNYDLFVGISDFIDNLRNDNNIASQSYKSSRFIPYALMRNIKSKFNISNSYISIQGFANYADELQNVSLFISSQFEPDNANSKKPRFLVKIPPSNSLAFDVEETKQAQSTWTVLDLTHNQYLDDDGYVTEFENIDSINETSVLLTIAYHNKSGLKTDYSRVFKISW